MDRLAPYTLALVFLLFRTEAAAGDPPAKIPAAVAAQNRNVCRVVCGNSVGSGCYLGDRLALTCRHLFDGESRQTGLVTFPDGSKYAWTLRGMLADWDSALIELSARPRHLRGVRLARSNPQPGQPLYLCGWSTGRPGFRPGVFRRTVGRPGGRMHDWGQMQRGAHGSAQSGDSGGPVFTASGRLVGNLWGSDGQATTFLMSGRLHRFLLPHNSRLARWFAALDSGWCPPGWTGKGAAVTVPTPTPQQKPTPIPAPEPKPAPSVGLTANDLEKLAGLIWVRMQRNPAPFRGPAGPVGPAPDLSGLASQLPPVVLEIHDRGKVYTQRKPLGEPIKLQVTGALNAR